MKPVWITDIIEDNGVTVHRIHVFVNKWDSFTTSMCLDDYPKEEQSAAIAQAINALNQWMIEGD